MDLRNMRVCATVSWGDMRRDAYEMAFCLYFLRWSEKLPIIGLLYTPNMRVDSCGLVRQISDPCIWLPCCCKEIFVSVRDIGRRIGLPLFQKRVHTMNILIDLVNLPKEREHAPMSMQCLGVGWIVGQSLNCLRWREHEGNVRFISHGDVLFPFINPT